MIALYLRTPSAGLTGKVSYPNLSFEKHAFFVKLTLIKDPDMILTDTHILAGNIRMYFPNAVTSNKTTYILSSTSTRAR